MNGLGLVLLLLRRSTNIINQNTNDVNNKSEVKPLRERCGFPDIFEQRFRLKNDR